jgi:hypothetical protein
MLAVNFCGHNTDSQTHRAVGSCGEKCNADSAPWPSSRKYRRARPPDTFHDDKFLDLKADFILANPPFNISDWGRATEG